MVVNNKKFEEVEIAVMILNQRSFSEEIKGSCVNSYVYYNGIFRPHAKTAFTREEFRLQGVNPSRLNRQRNYYPLLINGDLRD